MHRMGLWGMAQCWLHSITSAKVFLEPIITQSTPKNNHQDSSHSLTGGVAQAVEHLLCKCKALSSNHSPTKRNKKFPFPEKWDPRHTLEKNNQVPKYSEAPGQRICLVLSTCRKCRLRNTHLCLLEVSSALGRQPHGTSCRLSSRLSTVTALRCTT
jgi:hypothetical protein